MNRNGQFRDVTLRSVVANWASVSLILGAQPDFYSLWASGRPLICIPGRSRGGFLLCYIPLCYIRVRAPLWPNVFQNKNELTRRNVCGLAVARRTRWFHRHIPGMPRYVLAFLHLRQPLPLLHLGEGLWVEWCSSAE